jgi:hypothetical protein
MGRGHRKLVHAYRWSGAAGCLVFRKAPAPVGKTQDRETSKPETRYVQPKESDR